MSILKHRISDLERDQLTFLCQTIYEQNDADHNSLIKTSIKYYTELKSTALDSLSHFIAENLCDNSNTNVLILSNLPAFKAAHINTVILGMLLGKVVKEYEGGVWIKEIKSNPKMDEILDSPSSKDRKEFFLHTDLSYTDQPPHYFVFHCVSNPKNLGGMTTLCNLNQIINNLANQTISELEKCQFHFPAPSYYNKTGFITHPILSSINNCQYIRFRRDGLRSQTKNGIKAVVDLINAFYENFITVEFEPHSSMFINNRKCLHGRFSFLPNITNDRIRYFSQVYVETTA